MRLARLGHWGRTHRLFTAIAVAIACIAASIVSCSPASASIASDQAQITSIQQKIASQATRVKDLVRRETATQSTINTLKRQITHDERRLAADRGAEAAARDALRRVAVKAYITGSGMSSPMLEIFSDTSSITSALAQRQYMGAFGQDLSNTVAKLQRAEQATQADADRLRSAHTKAKNQLADLHNERRSINAAIKSEQQTVAQVKDDLQRQLLVEAEQLAQAAAEKALAKFPFPTADIKPIHLVPPTPGVYANPLRDITGLTPERIDMGVDYGGTGPIYALGDGIVLATSVPGWPGGTMIVYQLTDGPANGLVVYAAEDIAPSVQIGDTVNANTVLGLMYQGPDGIETGWGDPSVIGNALAGDEHEFDGSNTTAFGANFSQLLQSIGAPPGIPQNDPPTGTLPPDWPQW